MVCLCPRGTQKLSIQRFIPQSVRKLLISLHHEDPLVWDHGAILISLHNGDPLAWSGAIWGHMDFSSRIMINTISRSLIGAYFSQCSANLSARLLCVHKGMHKADRPIRD